MTGSKPKCGHSSLRPSCESCEQFKKKWYSKLKASDPDYRDIEYGLEKPDRLYEPVNVTYGLEDPDQVAPAFIDPITTAYYDSVLTVFHQWVAEGRPKRDCLIAELLGMQEGDTGTEQGIATVLKSRRLKPNSKSAVHQTIKEINVVVWKINQPHQVVDQVPTLHALDSNPLKDEADGQKQETASDCFSIFFPTNNRSAA